MTGLSTAPNVFKGGLVLIDAETAAVQRIITMQYNPDSLSRSLQIQGVGGEGGARFEALRLTGPAVETITLEAAIDAADQLEFPDQNPDAVSLGIHPQLAALEMLVNPGSAALAASAALADAGSIEILPTPAPLTIFVWSRQRVLPVRVTELRVTEEAFDATLNPIRARVNLGLRVLSVADVGADHRAGQLFMGHLQIKENLVSKAPRGALADFGLEGRP